MIELTMVREIYKEYSGVSASDSELLRLLRGLPRKTRQTGEENGGDLEFLEAVKYLIENTKWCSKCECLCHTDSNTMHIMPCCVEDLKPYEDANNG